MGGIVLMVSGGLVMAGATAGFVAVSRSIRKKKRAIQEEIRRIYN